jgi:hypothetical protein
MTFDLWTSDLCDPYMSITAHYIWAPVDHPNDWELQCEQLKFSPFAGHHSGANQAAVLLETFQQYGIDRQKVSFIFLQDISDSHISNNSWVG